MTPTPKLDLNVLKNALDPVIYPYRGKYSIIVHVMELRSEEGGCPSLEFMSGAVIDLHSQILALLETLHGESFTENRRARVVRLFRQLRDSSEEYMLVQ